MRAYVGNIPFGLTVDELKDLFAQYGSVQDVVIMTDRETGQSRGFGFVTRASPPTHRSTASGTKYGYRQHPCEKLL